MSSRPSFESLTDTLALLQLKPPSWGSEQEEKQTCPEDSKAVAAYLTQIVSSSLKWLKDDEQREIIYDMASKRLSERTGRSGMSAITRTWKIPATSSCPEIALEIHEPPLTEDHLGLKTWASSYLLARRLEIIGHRHLSGFSQNPLLCLELGAGTGLVGLAAAAIWGCCMHLTDLPDIVPNLSRNADRNIGIIKSRGGQANAAVHDWNDPPLITSRYQVMILFDPIRLYCNFETLIRYHHERSCLVLAFLSWLDNILSQNKAEVFDEQALHSFRLSSILSDYTTLKLIFNLLYSIQSFPPFS